MQRMRPLACMTLAKSATVYKPLTVAAFKRTRMTDSSRVIVNVRVVRTLGYSISRDLGRCHSFEGSPRGRARAPAHAWLSPKFVPCIATAVDRLHGRARCYCEATWSAARKLELKGGAPKRKMIANLVSPVSARTQLR